MPRGHMPIGRRERARQDKRERIMTAARELLAEHGVSRVTTQHIAERADVATGTLYLYASTKAELLIMVQNEKFAAAIDDGLTAAAADDGQGVLEAAGIRRRRRSPSAGPLAVPAPWPAIRPPLAFLQVLLGPADPAFPGGP